MKSSQNGDYIRRFTMDERQPGYPNLKRGGLTPERASEIGKKGVQVREARKTAQQVAQHLMNMKLYSGSETVSPEDVESLAELKGKNVTVREAVIIAQLQNALKGDKDAAAFVINTSGEKPAEKVELDMSIEDYVKSRKVKL